MMTNSTTEYHAKREKQELELAASSVSPAAREIHLALAKRYARLVQDAETIAPVLSLVK